MQRRDRQAGSGSFCALLMFALGIAPLLSGCESQARQDPLFVHNSTDALVFKDEALFRDRPLDDSLRGSLALTDYAVALDRTGLLTVLQRPGPFTVFAIPNQPLEQLMARDPHLLDPASLPGLRRTLSYTIVPGAYSEPRLRGMLSKSGGPVGLRTLDGDVLSVSIDPATSQLMLSDPSGQRTRLWLSNMPQSNGRLFVTQSMLTPSPAARTVASR